MQLGLTHHLVRNLVDALHQPNGLPQHLARIRDAADMECIASAQLHRVDFEALG